MVGFGMIFDETYRPFFEQAGRRGFLSPGAGVTTCELAAVVSLTGRRAEAYKGNAPAGMASFASFTGEEGLRDLLAGEVGASLDAVCIATPDDRHFAAARAALVAGKHVLIEKPLVLSLAELDELEALAAQKQRLVRVVYHKLFDPDHKRLRTLVVDGVLSHVNHGYCSLLEPKSVGLGQFAAWNQGRNPGTYVACHYLKLIDFTFGGRLFSVSATGQRGLAGPVDGDTWDSTQLRVTYAYPDGRTASFDIHTSWVTPDNFPGYVEQEVQFRFDNGVWNGHSRKRGVELTVEGRTPHELKTTVNTHYNGTAIEPWGERTQRGYGIEAIEQFFREVAYVEHGTEESGVGGTREERLQEINSRPFASLAADRPVVAAVQALEAILAAAAAGQPDGVVRVDDRAGGLTLWLPGDEEPRILHVPAVYER
ncbi:MAG: gfo/Idh/MocA family oxidoreductase [Planctomyces sp.]|nr:gfo/Idh/MocA family oxidoreductase [Planctomyces sp.]